MGTKLQELEKFERGQGCLGNADDDEPIFILRAQDALAADLVERWAIQAQAVGCPHDKVLEAHRLADDMRRWPKRKNPD